VVFFRARFIARAAHDRQNGVFAKTGVGFGATTHDKKAAFRALDYFDVLATGAQPDMGRDLHGRSLAWNLVHCQDPLTVYPFFKYNAVKRSWE
jgi:hypothetical protein